MSKNQGDWPMQTSIPRRLLEIEYDNAARDYLRSLPLEHFMEAIPQATQRKITVSSFDLVHVAKPEIQTFSELLIQYEQPTRGKRRKIGQVVPDNMVVVCDEPIKAEGSYNLPLQPKGPFWVFEYVSNGSKRKDYVDSFDKYEKELKVPYYLTFYPDNEELTLYRHNGTKYVTVLPDEHGRYAVPELEMELALLDGWVRYWFRGELLPLPADLLKELNATKKELKEERKARLAAEQEVERLRAQLAARDKQ
jgi:hypothetical protein